MERSTLVSVIIVRAIIFVPIGMGQHVRRGLVVVSLRGIMLVLRLMVFPCPIVAVLIVVGALAEPMAVSVVPQGRTAGRHAVALLLALLVRASRVVDPQEPRVKLGTAAHV